MKNGAEDIKRHRWFKNIDWEDVFYKKIKPPIVPNVSYDGKKYIRTTYIVDVLWGQRIKLIQVASHSELHEYQWNDLLFFEIVPSPALGPRKYKHKIGHNYFTFQHLKQLGTLF